MTDYILLDGYKFFVNFISDIKYVRISSVFNTYFNAYIDIEIITDFGSYLVFHEGT